MNDVAEEHEPPVRTGSYADLSRRVDRVEQRVDALTAAVARVETNQDHAAELTKLRFDALDTGLNSVGGQLRDFIKRVEGIITGEVQTAQTRQAQDLLSEWQRWRKETDDRLDTFENFATQVRFLGRITAFLIGGNALAIVVAIAALIAK